MTRVTSILSGKGGTGKTFTAANLSIALQELGEQVVCVDTDLNSANLAMQLGHEVEGHTLDDAIGGEVNGLKAVSVHESGLMFIPASLHLSDENISPERLGGIIENFSGFADRIIIDAPPGFGDGFRASVQTSDDILLVTNPELQAIHDARKIVKEGKKSDVEVGGMIVNKCQGLLEELSDSEIEEIAGTEVLMKIPHLKEVQRSIHRKRPMALDEHSPVGIKFRKLAAKLSGVNYDPPWYSPLVRLSRKIWG